MDYNLDIGALLLILLARSLEEIWGPWVGSNYQKDLDFQQGEKGFSEGMTHSVSKYFNQPELSWLVIFINRSFLININSD